MSDTPKKVAAPPNTVVPPPHTLSRSAKNSLRERKPELTDAVMRSSGDLTAAAVVTDIAVEEGIVSSTGKLITQILLEQVGQRVWVEGPNWSYVGLLAEVGLDYFRLDEVGRVLVDGCHHVMMTTGSAPGMEVEWTGGPDHRLWLKTDCLVAHCLWPFTAPPHTS